MATAFVLFWCGITLNTAFAAGEYKLWKIFIIHDKKGWWQAHMDSLRDSTVNVRGLLFLSLTSMFVRGLTLLYDKMGGFLKMVFSKRWFCILSQFGVSIFLRLHTDEWYAARRQRARFAFVLLSFVEVETGFRRSWLLITLSVSFLEG